MKLRTAVRISSAFLVFASLLCWSNDGKPVTVRGYVLDSACAFTKDLKKPVSPDCAQACAKAGSPLVILSDSGTIYWPIALKRPEGEAPAFRWPEGYSPRKGVSARWFDGHGDRKNRGPVVPD
jgi:hypothetical protein